MQKQKTRKKERSVLAVLCSDDFPSVEPLVCTGTNSSDLYSHHDKTFLTKNEFTVHDTYPIVSKPKFECQNLTSALLAADLKQYDNESDLRLSVNFAISDTIKICNKIIHVKVSECGQEVPFDLKWRTESTLFSNVIDHIVIYDAKSNTPIFVVEATIRLKDILKNEKGDMDLGQCHDQLVP